MAFCGWHFLPEDRRLRFGARELVEAGQTYRIKPPLRLGKWGLHAAVRALDALYYGAQEVPWPQRGPDVPDHARRLQGVY